MEKPTIVYLMRHGSITLKPGDIFCGNPEISKEGIEESKKVAKGFEKLEKKISVMYTSTLKRAHQTAEIIGNTLKVEVIKIREFEEFEKALFEKSKFNLEFWKNYLKYDEAKQLFEKIIKKREGENILFVLHGNVIKGILKSKMKISFKKAGKFRSDNCGITKLIFLKNKLKMVKSFNSSQVN